MIAPPLAMPPPRPGAEVDAVASSAISRAVACNSCPPSATSSLSWHGNVCPSEFFLCAGDVGADIFLWQHLFSQWDYGHICVPAADFAFGLSRYFKHTISTFNAFFNAVTDLTIFESKIKAARVIGEMSRAWTVLESEGRLTKEILAKNCKPILNAYK